MVDMGRTECTKPYCVGDVTIRGVGDYVCAALMLRKSMVNDCHAMNDDQNKDQVSALSFVLLGVKLSLDYFCWLPAPCPP